MVASKPCGIRLFTVSLFFIALVGPGFIETGVVHQLSAQDCVEASLVIPVDSEILLDFELLDQYQQQCPVTCKTALGKVFLLTVYD